MVTMDVLKKCVGMLCGVDPGLDAGVLTQRLGELETVKFSDFVKSMNYLSLFNDGDRQQALRKCGLSPKMSDLVTELGELGINYGTAVNLFWEETADEDGVQYLSMVGFPRSYARFTADFEVLRDETLSAGPVGMQAVWQRLVAPSQVSSEPEALAQAIVHKLVRDGVVSASDEVGYSQLLSSSPGLDVVQADVSSQYLGLFDETEKSAVFSDLGFSPDASALAKQVAFRKLSSTGYRCDLADVMAVDGDLVVRMVLNETSGATDRAELVETLNVCAGSVFGHSQCRGYPRYVWASDGLCYLDAFLLKNREEMREKHGTLPVLTDVFSLENACGFDYDRMRSLHVHFLRGIAHISSVPSDLSVLFMVTQLANPRHPIRGCMAQVRVGGHSGSKIRRDYNVGHISVGEKFSTDLPIDFDFGQDVTCAEGDLMVEQLPVPEGLVVIALSPEERLRAEEELEWLDVPVVLLSHVEDKEFAHVWVVSYGSETDTKLVSKLRVTADSGHTFGFLEGPKVGGLNHEIRLWCKSEAIGLGFTLDGVEVGKDPDKFLEWCDVQTVGIVPELVELPVSAMLGTVIGDPYRPLDVVVDDLVRGCSTVERARHFQMPKGVSVLEESVVHLSSLVDMGRVNLVWDNLFLAERDLSLEMVVAVVVWAARRGLRCDVQLTLKDGIWYVVPKVHASIRDALAEMVDTLKREMFVGDFRLRNIARFKEIV